MLNKAWIFPDKINFLTEGIYVSSAKIKVGVVNYETKSFMNLMKNKGPMTEPWGHHLKYFSSRQHNRPWLPAASFENWRICTSLILNHEYQYT